MPEMTAVDKVNGKLVEINDIVDSGPFIASWDSLSGYRVPEWYSEGKFGIFIHWGLYSVPAFGNEWYPRNMYIEGTPEYKHHVDTYGLQKTFGYKDFIPLFKAEKYDPAEWADLFRRSGARFVVPVAEHHDGFAMYDCSFSEWNAAQMGPKRDLIGELAAEVRRQGMVFGLSTHRAEHWWFFDAGRKFDSDVNGEEAAKFYWPAKAENGPLPDAQFLDEWLARTCELIDKYQPQLLWFDWWIEKPVYKPYLQKLAAYYYNRGSEWNKGVAINYKTNAFEEGTAVFDVERGQLTEISERFWQTDTAVSKNSWGYIASQDYKTSTSIIHDLIDIVSKNGALLLNIGPKPDGTIPEPEVQMLLEIGEWLTVNGEAIYGTRPWKVFGEGPTEVVGGTFNDIKRASFTPNDIRFTAKDDTLYIISLGCTGVCEELSVRSLGRASGLIDREIADIRLLGCESAIGWSLSDEALSIRLPDGVTGLKHSLAFSLTFKG